MARKSIGSVVKAAGKKQRKLLNKGFKKMGFGPIRRRRITEGVIDIEKDLLGIAVTSAVCAGAKSGTKLVLKKGSQIKGKITAKKALKNSQKEIFDDILNDVIDNLETEVGRDLERIEIRNLTKMLKSIDGIEDMDISEVLELVYESIQIEDSEEDEVEEEEETNEEQDPQPEPQPNPQPAPQNPAPQNPKGGNGKKSGNRNGNQKK